MIIEHAVAAERARTTSSSLHRRRFTRALFVSFLFLCLASATSLWVGYEHITIQRLQTDPIVRSVFFTVRLPRVIMAGVIGATLASVGGALQALFRNPLAEPLTLGVSGGGALGASLAIAFGWSARIAGTPVLFVCAFLGALASVSLVYGLARTSTTAAPHSLLLAGVVINLITDAAVLTIEYTVDPSRSLQILRWLVGTLDVVGFATIWRMLVVLIPGWFGLLLTSRNLTLLSVDAEAAASLGVDVQRTERTVYLLASLLVGVTVAVGGSIGFVGLIVPHAARILFGQDSRVALPSSLFLGAGFLMLADAIARTALGQAELPVGAITGILGGPFFLWLMTRQGRTTYA